MEQLRNGMHKIADDFIDIAFREMPEKSRKRYKDFQLRLVKESKKSRLGLYNLRTKTIEISGIFNECRHDIIITYLHELSHHIEYINTGNTGHQKSFYDIHIKLLKLAVDFDILKIEQITNNKTSTAGNRKKLAKLMQGYVKNTANQNCSEKLVDISCLSILPETVKKIEIIKVKSLPENKDVLKKNGYKWDAREVVWQKTTETVEEHINEQEFLKKNGFYLIKIDGKTYYSQTIRIKLYGKTYEARDTLVMLGYKFTQNAWQKNINVNSYNAEMRKLKNIRNIKVVYGF